MLASPPGLGPDGFSLACMLASDHASEQAFSYEQAHTQLALLAVQQQHEQQQEHEERLADWLLHEEAAAAAAATGTPGKDAEDEERQGYLRAMIFSAEDELRCKESQIEYMQFMLCTSDQVEPPPSPAWTRIAPHLRECTHPLLLRPPSSHPPTAPPLTLPPPLHPPKRRRSSRRTARSPS